MFQTNIIRLLNNFYFIFRRRYLIIKKNDTENVPTQIHGFERRLCTVIIHRGKVLYVSNES